MTAIINPLLGRSYNSPEELNAEIRSVFQQLCSAAQESLPLSRASNKRGKWYKDQTLAQLAACKKTAWDEWSANGRPTEGPLHDRKIKTRAEFRKRMKICAANEQMRKGRGSSISINSSRKILQIASSYLIGLEKYIFKYLIKICRKIGAFHVKLNPISGKTIFDTCVIPILLFGSENWILTDPLVDQLEAFQGEIGKRIFKLSKFHLTISIRLALKWPSIAARIIILKLSLLLKISSDGGSIGSRIYSSLTATDSQLLRILQECKSLEDKLGCLGATNTVLNAEASMKEVKRRILKIDWDACLSTASQHDSTAVAAKISSSVSWMKLWDRALDHGPRGTAALQVLYRVLTRPRFGQNVCSICDTQPVETYFEHYTICHTPIHSLELVIDALTSDIFEHARHFL